jgi:hypothetical protein
MTTAYPLTWPEGWPRTPNPGSSQFKTGLPAAIKNVNGAIAAFARDSGKKMEGVVISSNCSLGNERPKDAGIAVYFTWDGLSTCIAVDRYQKIEDNLQAIFHCIEAERVKLRHGGINLVRAAFRGYAALPPPSATRPWWEVFGWNTGDASRAEIDARFRELAQQRHPDKGGSDAMMAELNAAYAQAKKGL